MQKARRQAFTRRCIALRPLVGTWFQVLFHSPPGVLFISFAHATGSLSVAEEYLALDGGPPEFTPAFPRPALLGFQPEEDPRISRTGLSPSVAALSRAVQLSWIFVTLSDLRRDPRLVPRPRLRNACGLDTQPVWAHSLSLAATEEVASLSFPGGT